MRNRIRIILFIFLLANNLYAADRMCIRVEADPAAFSLRKLQTGIPYLTNRGKYTLEQIPGEFEGFEYLANAGGIVESGVIIPQEDGFIYLIAKTGLTINGWEPTNASIVYDDGANTPLSVYKRNVRSGERIAIPELSDFRGFSPLAARIIYNEPVLKVEGDLLDIRKSETGAMIFPQNNSLLFPASFPASLQGIYHAVSLIENQGVKRVKADSECVIRIAVPEKHLIKSGWVSTGESFIVNASITFHVYTYSYATPGEWVDIPQAVAGTNVATLVFANKIQWENPRPIPGTAITKTLSPKEISIANPSIVILPDGDYLAVCSGAYRYAGESARVSFFLSSDKGKTWKVRSKNSVQMNFCNLFVHRGELYLMGPKGGYNGIVIRKSNDKGMTWTEPNETSGILLTDLCHTAPVPVLEHAGRIWRAVELTTSDGKDRRPFVMSAPADSDLMDSSVWTVSNALPFNRNWFNIQDIGSHSYSSLQWIEGNVVADRDGNVVNILRVDETRYGKTAAITRLSGITDLSFDPSRDFIEFPGGGKKFTIRYDAVSDRYWTLSNAVFEEDKNKTHLGITQYGYNYPLHGGLFRNRLVLMHSDNLREWTVKDTLLSSDNPFFHGFQYVDWQFDGEDIIAVSRMAYEGEDGLPLRQHDANYLVFHRFEKFREKNSGHSATPQITDKRIIRPIAGKHAIELSGMNRGEKIDLQVYDLTGKQILSMIATSDNNIPFHHKGIFILQIRHQDTISTHKIISNE